MRAYLDAGVKEYWVVDARPEPARFDIYKAGAKGFTASRKTAGWVKSPTFGKSFRLDVGKDPTRSPNLHLAREMTPHAFCNFVCHSSSSRPMSRYR